MLSDEPDPYTHLFVEGYLTSCSYELQYELYGIPVRMPDIMRKPGKKYVDIQNSIQRSLKFRFVSISYYFPMNINEPAKKLLTYSIPSSIPKKITGILCGIPRNALGSGALICAAFVNSFKRSKGTSRIPFRILAFSEQVRFFNLSQLISTFNYFLHFQNFLLLWKIFQNNNGKRKAKYDWLHVSISTFFG